MEQSHSFPERPEPGRSLVPYRAPRHGEWTSAKMAAFLRELAASQSVSHAARSVGMSRQSAYKLRARMAGTPFALGWEVALEAGLQQLAHAVLDRALNGVEQPYYYHGELVGTRRHYDNRLAVWLLQNPWKLGRYQVARESAAGDLDGLLARIEAEGPRWEGDDFVPDPEHAAQARVEHESELIDLVLRRWYEDNPPPGSGPAPERQW